MHLGPPVPTGAAFRAGNPGSRRAPGLVRREEALLLCGPGISPLLTQLPPPVPSGRAQALVPPAAQAHNSSPSRKAARAPSLSEPGSRPPGPQEGGGGAAHCTADSGRRGGVESQVFGPPPLFLRHLLSPLCVPLSLVKPPGWEGGGQSLSHAPSCPARGGAQVQPGPQAGFPWHVRCAASRCTEAPEQEECVKVCLWWGGGGGSVWNL